VKVARVQAVMLMFAGVLGGMQNAPAAHRLLAAPEVSVASGFCEGPFAVLGGFGVEPASQTG
jgi:hypothetical protein